MASAGEPAEPRPGQRLLRRGPRRAARGRLPRRRRARPPRRLGSRPGADGRQPAAPRPLRAGDGAGHDDAHLLGRHRRRARPRRRRLAAWMFDAALAGEVFAAGHAESGNDIPVLLSTCRAERVEGGYRLHRPQAVRLQRSGLDVARRPRHRRRCAGRSADRARVRAPLEPRGHRRRDLGHPRHASDAEPRHDPRRRVRARRPDRPGRAGRRRQRSVPRRDGHVAAVVDRRRLPRDRRTGPRGGGRRRPTQDVGGHRARRLRLQPDGAAPGRRDVPRAGRRDGHGRALRRRLGGAEPTTATPGCPRSTP